MSVPVQPAAPAMLTLATDFSWPGGTGLPPTTAWAGAAHSATAASVPTSARMNFTVAKVLPGLRRIQRQFAVGGVDDDRVVGRTHDRGAVGVRRAPQQI